MNRILVIGATGKSVERLSLNCWRRALPCGLWFETRNRRSYRGMSKL